MNVGILCEGSVDFPLIAAILKRIAKVRARIDWPIQPRDAIEEIRIPKRGFGQVEKAIKRIVALEEEMAKYAFLVIVLDQKTKLTQGKVRELLRGRQDFVLGVAHREIEAWWLSDRRNVLEWLRLQEGKLRQSRYRAPYSAEQDDNPKRTLDELTEISTHIQSRYGEGNTDLARDFAEMWSEGANLGQIATACPRGFAPFLTRSEQLFKKHRNRPPVLKRR